MTRTPATRALEQAAVAFTLREYTHDPQARAEAGGYGLEAADALGVDPATVFKTLVTDVEGLLVVAVVPVVSRLDLKAVAAAVGAKRATMADPTLAQRATGYVLGGISPLGQRKRLTTVLDASAHGHERILVSAGRRGLDLELAPADLARLTGAVTAAIALD